MPGSPRIFIGLTEIAGYYSQLKKGFDRLHVDCDYYYRDDHPFKYEMPASGFIQKLFSGIAQKRKTTRNKFGRLVLSSAMRTMNLILLLYSLFKYDVFIFGYKQCFFPKLLFVDLMVLKLFKKTIIFVFNGSDARAPYGDGAILSDKKLADIRRLVKASVKQKRDITIIEKYADFCVVHHPTATFFTNRCVSFLHLGMPVEKEVSQEAVEEKLSGRETTIILHCPSHPEAKGTDRIRSAIKSLKGKGHQIEFVEIIGKPHSFVLEQLQQCDFVVDQMYSPTPMPGFVTEAAFFRKPAVICGYFHDQIREILPPDMVPPSHYVHPDDVEPAIETLINDRDYRAALGAKAHTFVTAMWAPEMVAGRFLKLIDGTAPNEWFFDPRTIVYVLGACISEERGRNILRTLINHAGAASLQVPDKPSQEKAFVKFALHEPPEPGFETQQRPD